MVICPWAVMYQEHREEQQAMLEAIGFTSMEDLFRGYPGRSAGPGYAGSSGGKERSWRCGGPWKRWRQKTMSFATMFRGAGAYRHYIPAMVKNVISKEDLQTAYTPYQAEISQGILQSIFEYQTMICRADGHGRCPTPLSTTEPRRRRKRIAMCRERKRTEALDLSEQLIRRCWRR